MHGVAILNEVIEDANKKKVKRIIFKVDFAKAYDSMDWNFLLQMMERMEFPTKWRAGIRECVSTASSNVLVNGSPSGEFRLERGVRQGDPLSPFLFLITVEGLNLLIKRAVKRGLLSPARVGPEGISVSHLQCAYDTLFVAEGLMDNIKAIKWVLRYFELMSGLAVNFDKCRLCGLNLSDTEVTEMATMIGCQSGALSIDYLGMKVGSGLNRLCNWHGVVDKVKSRLVGWDGKRLSMGDQATLVKWVLASIPIYTMSFSPIPAGTANALRKLQSNFLWGSKVEGAKKIAWIKWEEICKKKDEGGLGVKNWRWLNLALLGKWVWRFFSQGDNLWAKVIRARHGRGVRGGICLSGNGTRGALGGGGKFARLLKEVSMIGYP